MVRELGVNQDQVNVFCENQSTKHLTKIKMYHERTKHIDLKFHFIREIIQSERIKIEKIHTLDNPENILTKSVVTGKLR